MRRQQLVPTASAVFVSLLLSALAQPPASAQTPDSPFDRERVSDTESALPRGFPSAPVLTVSAGILPTSPFWALDRFDEWMQRTLFTFGVRRLRAQAALLQAAERVAELQVLESHGVRTSEQTVAAIDDVTRLLELSATIIGEDYTRGGRPIALTLDLLRTTTASVDALEPLVGVDAAESSAATDPVAREEEAGIPRSVTVSISTLGALETHIETMLFPNLAVVPPQVVQRVVLEKLAGGERDVERMLNALASAELAEGIVIAGDELTLKARVLTTHAATVSHGGAYADTLTLLRTVREMRQWVASGALTTPRDELTVDPQAASHVDRLLNELVSRGLLSNEERTQARSRVEEEGAP